MGLILSIDVGTTSIKSALVDETGNIVGDVHQEPNQLITDASGKAVHDPIALKEALFRSIEATVEGRASLVDGIGLSKYQFGMLLLDKELNPLTQISTFADSTAQGNLPKFMTAIDPTYMYETTGCPPLAQYPVNRLHHIAQTDPTLASQVRHIWGVDAFVMHTLTGNAVSDYSTANSMGALNLAGEWDPQIMKEVGFSADFLPKVVDGLSHLSELKPELAQRFGLKRNLPISVGVYDGAALAAAVTGFAPGIAVGNLGTSGMLRVPSNVPVADTLDSRLLQSCLIRPRTGDEEPLYFVGAGISNGTVIFANFLKKYGKDFSFFTKELSRIGSNAVFTYPYLGPERDALGAKGTGAVVGIRHGTTIEDEGRSLMEGLAMSFLNILRRLSPGHQMIDGEGQHVPPLNNAISRLYMGGGGSCNSSLLRIIADTLNLDITAAPLAKETDRELLSSGIEPPLREMGVLGAAAVFQKCLAPSFDLKAHAQRISLGGKTIVPIAENVAQYVPHSGDYFAIRKNLSPIYEIAMSNRERVASRDIRPIVQERPRGESLRPAERQGRPGDTPRNSDLGLRA